MLDNIMNHFFVHGCVTNHTAPADALLSGLKLRLDEDHSFRMGRQ